jgi:uncharacterized protein (DUF1697 family)
MTCFEDMGFADVATHIQSGNVVFTTAIADQALLGRAIETGLSRQFKHDAKVVVVSLGALRRAPRKPESATLSLRTLEP